jgi:hypothetical protein
MIGFNGGLIGKDRSTSGFASAPGVWTLGEQIKAQRSGLWPIVNDDPYFANVSLLLRGDGTNGSTTITDSSPSPKTVTAFGNAQISTVESKFGGASIAFDGSGDYLTTPANSDFSFDADFTIEMWLKTSVFSQDTVFRRVASNGPNISNAIELLFFNGSGATPNICVNSNTILINGSISAATGNWVHIAVSRSGSAMKLFVDGIQSGSTATTSTNFSAGSTFGFIVGRFQAGAGHLNGYIDDLRITKGVARYTANFTPPGAL